MPDLTNITALVIAPAATDGTTSDMYFASNQGGSVLAIGLASASTWDVDRLVLVLGDDAELLLDVIDLPLEVVIDPEWEEGPAASLRVGLDVVTRADTSDAVVVASLDRTLPDADTVAALVETARTTDRPITAAKYRYAYDYPYLVHADVWPRLLGLEGSSSLDSFVATHPERVEEMWIDHVPPRRFRSADDVGATR